MISSDPHLSPTLANLCSPVWLPGVSMVGFLLSLGRNSWELSPCPCDLASHTRLQPQDHVS